MHVCALRTGMDQIANYIHPTRTIAIPYVREVVLGPRKETAPLVLCMRGIMI